VSEGRMRGRPTKPRRIARQHSRPATISSHKPLRVRVRTGGGGWVATYEDITERKRIEATISHDTTSLNLPNRRVFGEKVNEALARVKRGDTLTVFFVDLDNFKRSMTRLGHSAGDALLKAVARRLQDCLREIDTVARLGGDEFAVLLHGLDRRETSIVADRIIQSLCAPYGIDRHEVVIGASIGAASAPDDANDAETLKSADTAVYRAKEEGRGTFRFFLPAMMHVEPSLLRKPAPCALARAI
jgi:diguanylate cyclase (GGDEF)-like protein